MLFKNLKNQGSSNIPIGSLFAKDGAQFIIEEVDATYSRSFSKIKEKADIHSERQLIIKNNNTVFEPYEITAVPLDLHKSSSVSNEALLEYLSFGGNVNNLILESDLDAATIMKIIETPKYRNEFTLSYLAVNQNLFVSDNLVNSLGTQEKLRLYTENKHRTVEIMEDYKSDFKTLIDTILNEYISGKSDYISENPSDIRIKISKTMHDFYQDDSVIQEPKDTTLRLLEKERNKVREKIETVEVLKQAVSKYKITGDGWQEKKQLANDMIADIENENNEILNKINNQIKTIRTFPI